MDCDLSSIPPDTTESFPLFQKKKNITSLCKLLFLAPKLPERNNTQQ